MADLNFSQGADPVAIFNDQSGNQLIVDNSGSAVIISLEHYLTHQGLYFYFQDYATAIANGAIRDILVITANNGKVIHSKLSASTLGGTYIIYESPTTTANGSSITVQNKNRSSANTATLNAFSTPTVTSVGTQLGALVLSATGKSTIKEIFGADDEIVLKSNTKYLIRFISSTGNNTSAVGLSFYEV